MYPYRPASVMKVTSLRGNQVNLLLDFELVNSEDVNTVLCIINFIDFSHSAELVPRVTAPRCRVRMKTTDF